MQFQHNLEMEKMHPKPSLILARKIRKLLPFQSPASMNLLVKSGQRHWQATDRLLQERLYLTWYAYKSYWQTTRLSPLLMKDFASSPLSNPPPNPSSGQGPVR